MSIKRIALVIASLVCNVDSTRWPVKAALNPISTVSWSRISPTIIMSGSCLRAVRKILAKLSPILLFICTWLIRPIRYSTGSSTVIILLSCWFNSLNAPYSVVVLPEPVGPVTKTMPCGRFIMLRTRFNMCTGMPVSSNDNNPAD